MWALSWTRRFPFSLKAMGALHRLPRRGWAVRPPHCRAEDAMLPPVWLRKMWELIQKRQGLRPALKIRMESK